MKVSWKKLAEIWYKLLAVVVSHWSSQGYEETHYWKCPHSACNKELEAPNKEKLIDRIEQHLKEDKAKGLIR